MRLSRHFQIATFHGTQDCSVSSGCKTSYSTCSQTLLWLLQGWLYHLLTNFKIRAHKSLKKFVGHFLLCANTCHKSWTKKSALALRSTPRCLSQATRFWSTTHINLPSALYNFWTLQEYSNNLLYMQTQNTPTFESKLQNFSFCC